MQTRKTSNARHVQSTQTSNPYTRYMQTSSRRPVILTGVLCLLLPFAGIPLAWRARRIPMALRSAFSALGFLSMTLIFVLLMRPAKVASDIRPTPAVPVQAGYGTTSVHAATDEPLPETTAVPAAQDAAVSSNDPSLSETNDPSAQSDEVIVYAVTNNASSYHLAPVCDMQENNRQLTLSEALAEGLQPCEKCAGAAG